MIGAQTFTMSKTKSIPHLAILAAIASLYGLHGLAGAQTPPEPAPGAEAATPAAPRPAPGAEEATPAAPPPAAGAEAANPAATPAATPAAPRPAAGPERQPRLNTLPALLGVPSVLPADDTAAGKGEVGVPMTLIDAVRLGLDHSLEVEAGEFRYESFNQTRRAARGALLPKLDLRVGSGVGRLETGDPRQSLDRLDSALTLKQPVWDTPARKEWQRQKVLTSSAAIQLDGTRSSTALEVSGAYLQVLQTRLATELSQGYEKLLIDLLAYIDARTAAGAASKADQDRVKARVANARASIADAKAVGRVAQLNLRRLIGDEAKSMVFVLPTGLRVPAEATAAREVARERNHDLLASAKEIDAIRLEVEGSRGRFEPRAELEMSVTKTRNISGSPAVVQDAKLMFMVTVPLLNGGTDQAQMRGAAARLSEQTARAANVERKLAQELEAGYVNLEAFDQRFAAARDELTANAAVVKAFQEQMTGANRTLLDVLDAYQRFHQSKLDILQLAVGETQTQLRIAHLTGLLLEGLAESAPPPR
jgi:adhesin transport system outer membrane protein